MRKSTIALLLVGALCALATLVSLFLLLQIQEIKTVTVLSLHYRKWPRHTRVVAKEVEVARRWAKETTAKREILPERASGNPRKRRTKGS